MGQHIDFGMYMATMRRALNEFEAWYMEGSRRAMNKDEFPYVRTEEEFDRDFRIFCGWE